MKQYTILTDQRDEKVSEIVGNDLSGSGYSTTVETLTIVYVV